MRIGDPPAGSSIQVQSDLDGMKLEWKRPTGGAMRYGIVAFLLVWLGGWTVGGLTAIRQVLHGDGGAFLLFWLGGWALGMLFAGGMAFSLLRPQRPESIKLGMQSLTYDTGSARAAFMVNSAHYMHQQAAQGARNPMKPLFMKRKVYEFARSECPEFVLEGLGDQQRLRFDVGADRVLIGETLKEPEREWLAHVLQAWREA
jgi:hypothetical protein